MATSSHWAGNAYAQNSIRPAVPTQQAFVRSSGTVATGPAQPTRVADRRHVQIPPATPPPEEYYTDEDTPPKRGIPFWMWVLIVVLVASVLFGIKVNYLDPWWQGVENQIHYGDSRMGYSVLQLTGDATPNNIITFVRTDTKTGSAYLIVIDVQPGKAPQQFIKPIMGPDATNQTVTTASTEDVNGDGRTDVLIHIQESPVTFALLNDGRGHLTWQIP